LIPGRYSGGCDENAAVNPRVASAGFSAPQIALLTATRDAPAAMTSLMLF